MKVLIDSVRITANVIDWNASALTPELMITTKSAEVDVTFEDGAFVPSFSGVLCDDTHCVDVFCVPTSRTSLRCYLTGCNAEIARLLDCDEINLYTKV